MYIYWRIVGHRRLSGKVIQFIMYSCIHKTFKHSTLSHKCCASLKTLRPEDKSWGLRAWCLPTVHEFSTRISI